MAALCSVHARRNRFCVSITQNLVKVCVTVLLVAGNNSTLVAEGKVSRHDMTHLIYKLIRRFGIILYCVSDLFSYGASSQCSSSS